MDAFALPLLDSEHNGQAIVRVPTEPAEVEV
jgi:hypothetical protein